jgi:glycosyltransferase involved in cell wall biosynthesis
MGTQGSVSIALATFNGARYLPEQLRSLAEQTLLPRELVACDDGSADETIEILEQFARDASFPVQVVRNERRLGYADNFLAAAALCTGELVAFCDQDDFWLETKLEACEGEARRTGAAIVAHSGAVADEWLRPTGRRVPHARRRRVVTPGRSDPWWDWWGYAMVFERRLLEVADPGQRVESQFLPAGAPLDHDDWISFLGCALAPIAFIPEALVLHRRHPETITQTPAQTGRIEASRELDDEWHRTRYADLERMALERGRFWRRTAPPLSGREHDLALRAAERYDRSAAAYGIRQKLYASPCRPRRAGTMAAMLATGAYRRRANGGVGLGALAKDAYFAVRPSPA